jgi:hypothetical protein
LLRTLISFGPGEVGAVKKVPILEATAAERKHVGTMAETLHDLKSAGDSGNEIGTRFDRCWVIQPATTHEDRTFSTALDAVFARECQLEATLTQTDADLNTAVCRLDGIRIRGSGQARRGRSQYCRLSARRHPRRRS